MFDHGESCKRTGEIYMTHPATKISVPSSIRSSWRGLMTLNLDISYIVGVCFENVVSYKKSVVVDLH